MTTASQADPVKHSCFCHLLARKQRKCWPSGAQDPPKAVTYQFPLPEVNNAPTHASASLLAIHTSVFPKPPEILFQPPDAQTGNSRHREGSTDLKVTQKDCSTDCLGVFPRSCDKDNRCQGHSVCGGGGYNGGMQLPVNAAAAIYNCQGEAKIVGVNLPLCRGSQGCGHSLGGWP